MSKNISDANSVSRILGNITHELKTPLHSMLALAQNLLSESEGPINEEQRKQLGMITRNGEQLLELITQLLQYGTLESRTQKPLFELFDPRLLLIELGQTVDPLAKKQGIKLETNFSAVASEFASDRTLLRLVVMNIVSNALKFSPTGSSLSIYGANLHDGSLLIEVADSGIGIPQDVQQSIFGEFFQVENSESRRFGGVGLGLSLVKRALELLEGRIEVRSEVGQGSLFRITIPNAETKVQCFAVWVIDTESSTSLALETALGSKEFTVTVLSETDLPSKETASPSVIVIDVGAGDETGFKNVKKVRDLLEQRAIQVAEMIALGTLNDASARSRANTCGVAEYLAKPFDLNELLLKIRTLTDRLRR